MIIGIDASRANAEQKTGVEWYAYHVIQELKKNIPETVRVIVYSKEPLKGPLAELPSHWKSKVLSWPPEYFWTQLRLSLEMFFHPPDILFIPAHVLPIIHPKNSCITLHDVGAVGTPLAYNWFERWYGNWSTRFALCHAKNILVPSVFTKAELQTVYMAPAEKIHVTPLGIDPLQYRVIRDTRTSEFVLKKYGIEKPFVISIGRLEEKKNTAAIVSAFAKVRITNPSLHQLVLIGKFGFGYGEVQKTIDGYIYKQDIRVLGWIPEEEIPCILHAASLFVFPSVYEGFGIPVLQALACGVPVACSTNGSLPEVGGECVWYTDTNVDAIVRTIKMILENREERERKVQLGLEWIKKFTWKKTAEQTLQVLLEKK